jgi:protein-tyrosine phosphatase
MVEGLRDFLVAASKGGGRNFRTIGDWTTLDGGRVLRGQVFRCGHLGSLAEELRAEVSGLGLRTVVTLQTQQEIDILGDPIAALLPEVKWEHIPIGDRWFQKGSVLPDDTSSQGRFYVTMVGDYHEEWSRFLRLFADPDRYGILYHCTAGRDRTGVATLLLLETIRVPREQIVEDYLLSNEVFHENVQEAEVLQPLFSAIDEAGGIDAYLADIGLRPREIDAIRRNLTSNES